MSKVTKTQSSSLGTPVRKLERNETLLLKLGPFPKKPIVFPGEEDDTTVWDGKGRTQIAQIFILYEEDISSIAFQYIEDGKLVMSPFFGSQELTASNFVAVTFRDAPKEYITRVSGWHCWRATRSLTIETNKRSYGPFGNPQSGDTKFDLSFGPENQFGGFHGLCCQGLFRSIGVYVKPIHTLATLSSISLDDFYVKPLHTLATLSSISRV